MLMVITSVEWSASFDVCTNSYLFQVFGFFAGIGVAWFVLRCFQFYDGFRSWVKGETSRYMVTEIALNVVVEAERKQMNLYQQVTGYFRYVFVDRPGKDKTI